MSYTLTMDLPPKEAAYVGRSPRLRRDLNAIFLAVVTARMQQGADGENGMSGTPEDGESISKRLDAFVHGLPELTGRPYRFHRADAYDGELAQNGGVLDTNVLVYLADNRDARKQAIALELVKSALDGRIDAWISVQGLTEFVNVALGKLKLSSETVDGLLGFFEQLQVVNLQPSFARRGMEIRSRYGLQYYDSVMLAAAEQIGVSEFYSEDLNEGQLYCGIRAVNPFAEKEVRP